MIADKLLTRSFTVSAFLQLERSIDRQFASVCFAAFAHIEVPLMEERPSHGRTHWVGPQDQKEFAE